MATKDVVSVFTDGSCTIDDDAANSATLAKFLGNFVVSNLQPDGRQEIVAEAQGALTGSRKGARAYPQLTFSGQVADFDDAFHMQAMGLTAAFDSVLSDIGDTVANDLTFDASYSTDTRTIVADDCVLKEWNMSQGEVMEGSFTMECRGPLSINGRVYVSSR